MAPAARPLVIGLVVGPVLGLLAMAVLALVQAPEGWEGALVLVYGMIGLAVGTVAGGTIGWFVGRRHRT